MQRRGSVSMPQWVQQCTKVMRAMSLSEMGGNLPYSVKRKLWARSSDNLSSTGDPLSQSVGTIATLKGKMSKRLSIVKGHFPKLIDCAHFHYENVDFGPIQLQFANDPSNDCWTLSPAKDAVFLVQVSCQGKTWLVRRTYEEFRTLDSHLHQCIYDRRYSQLDQLPPIEDIDETVDIPRLSEYLGRLSMIVDNKLNCGPVLTWMEIDNRGNQFLLKEEASLNVPAIGAAHVTKRYTAQANDEISIEVGDILSVIDMPPKEETSWWRGKHGFQVGFFPSECVELINERLSQSVSAPVPKQDSDNCSSKAGIVSVPGPNSPSSVSKKHGKLLGFLRTFMKSRPSKQKLKQRGILKERVFGCDLGEHLLNSGYEVPQVLSCCSEFIEKHGVVDGIYRHSGVSSNIQKLRHEFDSEIIPELTGELYMQDIHCVGSLCKLYFRELPNPLLTYQLYDKFADCMTVMSEEERLVKVHDVIQQLPPPHYRTLEFLMRHLSQLATRSKETNMHIKNLAIVWAPNLLRCKEIECVGLSGTDAFKEVRIQSVVVEFLLNHVDILFSDSFTSVGKSCAGLCSLTRPKSFVVSSLSSRLLSLEEAQARTQAHLLCSAQAGLLTLQADPMTFQGKYHTVIDIPAERRKSGMKVRKSAGGSWRAFFAIGKTPGSQRRKSARVGSLFQASQAEMGTRIETVTLRSAKSEESLCSQHSGAGLSKHQRLRRPRSSSDALSVTMETELLSTLKHCRSYDSVQAEDPEGVYMLPDFSHEASLWLAEDEMDFSPTYLDEAGLELEPLTFRCGPQRLITEDPDSLMNQSEVAVRKSFINQPPQRVQSCCQQHKTSAVMNPLTQTSEITSPAPEKLSKSTSFTRKMVHALSPKGNKSPPMDISEPISITVPAKVLEMIGGRAGEFQSASGAQNLATAAAQPPQMISMLLRSCDIQLTESCQQEIRSKLSFTESKVKGHSVPSFQLSEHSSVMDHSQLQAGFLMAAAPLPSQVPPPPPPKNPARLMALALAESANKAMKQSQREPRPQGGGGASLEARFMRSLSVDSNECVSSVANPLYSTVQSLSVWKPERGPQLQSEKGDSDGQKHIRSQPQESGTFSSQTSLSESGASTGSSSAETDSPYKPPQPKVPSATACQPQDKPPSSSNQAATTSSSVPELNVENQLPSKKPPAYSRQFSAPHLQHKHPAPPAKHTNHHHHPQFHHSKCKSSPIIHSSSHLRAFQPARPKVPPKPPELNAGFPLHRNESYSRRSQDQARPRMLLSSQSTPPFSRNDSEGVCYVDPKTHSHLDQSRGFAASSVQVYHNRASSNPQIFAGRSEDQVKHENFYYEIAPEPSFVQIPRYNYQNVGNQMALEGVPYRLPRPGFEHAIADRHLRSHDISVRPHLWTGISQNLNPTVDRSLAMQGNAGYTQIAGVPYSTVPQESPAHQPSASFRMVPVSRTEGAPNQGTSTYQRNLYRTQRSPSADLSASQLHPYFENGKVCYRYLEEGAAHEGETRVLQDYRPQAAVSAPKPPRLQEQPEPIYVNFPFNPGKAWTTTNLDGDQHSEPPPSGSSNDRSGTEPPLVFEENIASQESSSDPWQRAGSSVVSQYDNFSPSLDEKPQGSDAIHFRSKSDPGNGGIEGPGELQNLEEKDHVNHPTETPASESGSDGASRCLATLCEMPSHPQQQQHQHLQQQQQRAGFNVYAAGPVKPQWDGNPFAPRGTHTLREEPLRRSSSSAGHYSQAFDVMPSGDQVLKFYRAAQVAMNHPHPRSCVSFTPNPARAKSSPSCSTRQPEPNFRPTYSNQVSMVTEESAVRTPFTSMAQLSLTTTTSPRGPQPQLGFNPGILRTQQYNACQFNSSAVPGLPQYGNVPRREGLVSTLDPSFRPVLRTPAGVVRQGSLPAPNWTVHSEGQTRSYC
ncbi:rho GTPase-activating protein 33-like isoform X1 [Acipenser ruthenus]|uniref:rho GTPase-activating protein 33-like isoform X1 n=2 Tax=Acipenser ruthenus TaxID=7906 RepID=UPI002740E11D|nr:rho GTPase-activating protein 33-like isoform X1 [Acipenser ruthenus]